MRPATVASVTAKLLESLVRSAKGRAQAGLMCLDEADAPAARDQVARAVAHLENAEAQVATLLGVIGGGDHAA